jgi:MoaA/NifB/PqqE/SkfB family radical SAM enzyme
MIGYSNIKQVHLEISTRCNASCPLCPRNLSGYDTDLGYPVHDMTLEEAQKIFTEPFLLQLDKILINGNFGDFVTAKDGLEIVKYFKQVNPQLRIEISTNASAKPNIWKPLGELPGIVVGFDLDGLADTHHLYRRNTNWHMVISNAKKFIDAGGKAIWRMVVFDHNRHQVEECRKMSKELGFCEFRIINDGRDAGPVYNKSGDLDYVIGKDEAFKSGYPERVEIWEEWHVEGGVPYNRLQEYKVIPIKANVSCMAKNKSEIYVTATGEVYPCCWLGFYPKLDFKYSWQSDNVGVKDMVFNNNALEVGIEESILWFNAVEESWDKKAYSEGRLFKCDHHCGH